MSGSLNDYSALYEKPQGPGDARPTALQIISDNDLVDKLKGKVALVTGGTAGLGLETARALHMTGADVFITARDQAKGQKVIDDIFKTSSGAGKLDIIEMDMNSLASVKKAAESFLARSSTLNILVNNAGIMATPKGSKTTDGFEQQFGVNHLAHFTFTVKLLPALLRSSTPSFNSRVISVTSSAHRYSTIHWDDTNLTENYDPWVAYGQSKTATIWMSNYIDRVYGPRGVHALSVHPGGSLTALMTNMPQELLAQWDQDPAMMAAMMQPDQAAATSTWAATASVWEGKGGKYLYYCRVGEPAKDLMSVLDHGYGSHAFDEEGENRLWELSSRLTDTKVI